MKIVKFKTKNKELFIVDDKGNDVPIEDYFKVQEYERKYKVAIHDMLKDFCEKLNPKSKLLFDYMGNFLDSHNTRIGFDTGELLWENQNIGMCIRFNCFIGSRETSNETYVHILCTPENELIPQFHINTMQNRDDICCEMYKIFKWDELNLLFEYINASMDDKSYQILATLVKSLGKECNSNK
ncbi:MAG: hypothetical protein ACRC1P_10860 [Cellulosilyticaceae bacterium]